ncbi:hypothetical protein CSOJ01_08593 [Colletotrichum sojae]|uniref:Uncharacterized protein n=1 Tax=Colletotrichum sojae TaxID=2175907 RepID=A0A8H6MSL8_9PEZI|nr:hypothetical protein CSOJ01_08593 [Colletotrichum sojae]
MIDFTAVFRVLQLGIQFRVQSFALSSVQRTRLILPIHMGLSPSSCQPAHLTDDGRRQLPSIVATCLVLCSVRWNEAAGRSAEVKEQESFPSNTPGKSSDPISNYYQGDPSHRLNNWRPPPTSPSELFCCPAPNADHLPRISPFSVLSPSPMRGIGPGTSSRELGRGALKRQLASDGVTSRIRASLLGTLV